MVRDYDHPSLLVPWRIIWKRVLPSRDLLCTLVEAIVDNNDLVWCVLWKNHATKISMMLSNPSNWFIVSGQLRMNYNHLSLFDWQLGFYIWGWWFGDPDGVFGWNHSRYLHPITNHCCKIVALKCQYAGFIRSTGPWAV